MRLILAFYVLGLGVASIGLLRAFDVRSVLDLAYVLGFAATPSLVPGSEHARWLAEIRPVFRVGFWILLPLAILLAIRVWMVLAAPKRSRLSLGPAELSYSYNLPWNLNALIPLNWTIPLAEIRHIEFVNLLASANVEPSPGVVRLRVTSRNGTTRMLHPASWFLPGGPPHKAYVPKGKRGPTQRCTSMWADADNQRSLRQALAELPLIQALQARALPLQGLDNEIKIPVDDWFVFPAVKLGFGGGLLLIVASLLYMIVGLPHHLVIDFPLWSYALIVVLGLTLLAWRIHADNPRPPIGHCIVSALFWAAGLCFVPLPGCLFLNGLGNPTEWDQAFVIQNGQLIPTGFQTGVGPIGLPGKQSRHAWLAEGSTVSLPVRQGSLGLWEYDSAPLRALADAQGIR